MALRGEAGRGHRRARHQELITEQVEGSPEFAVMWARQDVRVRQEGLRRLRHPDLDRLDLDERRPSSERRSSGPARIAEEVRSQPQGFDGRRLVALQARHVCI